MLTPPPPQPNPFSPPPPSLSSLWCKLGGGGRGVGVREESLIGQHGSHSQHGPCRPISSGFETRVCVAARPSWLSSEEACQIRVARSVFGQSGENHMGGWGGLAGLRGAGGDIRRRWRVGRTTLSLREEAACSRRTCSYGLCHACRRMLRVICANATARATRYTYVAGVRGHATLPLSRFSLAKFLCAKCDA